MPPRRLPRASGTASSDPNHIATPRTRRPSPRGSVRLVKPILVIEQDPPLEGLGLLAERLRAERLPYRRIQTWRESLDEYGRPPSRASCRSGGTWARGTRPIIRSSPRSGACSPTLSSKVCRCSASVSVLRFWPSAQGDGEGGWLARDRLARRRSTPAADGDPLLGHYRRRPASFSGISTPSTCPRARFTSRRALSTQTRRSVSARPGVSSSTPRWTTSSSRSGSVTTRSSRGLRPRRGGDPERRQARRGRAGLPCVPDGALRRVSGAGGLDGASRPRRAAYALVAADEDASAAGPRPRAAAACAACRRSDRRTSSRIARGGRSRSGATPVELLLAMPLGEVVMHAIGVVEQVSPRRPGLRQAPDADDSGRAKKIARVPRKYFPLRIVAIAKSTVTARIANTMDLGSVALASSSPGRS